MDIKHKTSLEVVFLAAAATATLFLGHAALQYSHSGGDLCQNTDYKSLCRSVVRGITNPAQATEVAIKALISETIQEFEDSIDNLNTALKYLVINHDKDALNSYLSAAVTGYVTCDDTYADSGKASPLAQNTTLLGQMGSNCLALAIQIL
ncbi:hypothetical protein ACOSP7_018382 [Xanthoceras sorbifolium]